MGLTTIDPHSHKVQAKLYKIPKFGVIRPFENAKIYKEMYGHPDAVWHFDVFKSLYLSQN